MRGERALAAHVRIPRPGDGRSAVVRRQGGVTVLSTASDCDEGDERFFVLLVLRACEHKGWEERLGKCKRCFGIEFRSTRINGTPRISRLERDSQ